MVAKSPRQEGVARFESDLRLGVDGYRLREEECRSYYRTRACLDKPEAQRPAFYYKLDKITKAAVGGTCSACAADEAIRKGRCWMVVQLALGHWEARG
jgi:hypothetical protein